MISLDFIYAAFAMTLLAVIMVYYYSAVRERQYNSFKESKTWILGGIGYILMLVYNGLNSNFSYYLFYFFLITTLYLSLYILNKGVPEQVIVPPRFYLAVMVFNILWILYSIEHGNTFFITVLPSLLIQCAAFFFIGLIYLLHEDYEMSMRNISGMMYLMMTLTKLFYLLDLPIDSRVYLTYIFRVDFTLYLILSFVVVLFDYNRECMISNGVNKKLLTAFQSTPIGVLQINTRGDIIAMNDRVKNAILISEFEEFADTTINIHELSKLPFDKEWIQILEHLNQGKTYSLEADIFLGDEQTKYEFLFMPNLNELEEEEQNSNITCFILNSRRTYSVVSRAGVEEKQDYIIPNKYRLMELFDIGINQHMMHDFGVILIKVVNYVSITNIVNAHETTAIDHLVVSKLKKLDFVYCVGKVNQDTFEIITKDLLDKDEIHNYVNYVKDILSHQSFYDNEMNVYTLDYRIGISMAPNDGFSQRDLLRNASIAIAKAATEEKGYVQFYNEYIKTELANKLQLETKLRDGIFNDELFIEYQPQFTIQNEVIRGFEALVRWRLQDGTVMSPDEFIPLAEELRLMDELGEWVLRHSLIEATKWNIRYDKSWVLSVNISIAQLEVQGFAESVVQLIEEFDYPAHLLELEVTETKMAKSSDRVFLELKELQEFGVKIAIDDFGTGYSSLDYLRLLPFDILKIDKGFIERLHDNEMDHKIVESIIELINKMELESIAEGVETKEQLEFLRKTSCNYIQGFVYSRPLSKDAVIDLIIESLEDN